MPSEHFVSDYDFVLEQLYFPEEHQVFGYAILEKRFQILEYDFPDGSGSNQQFIVEALFIQEELYGKTLDISDGCSSHADGGSDDFCSVVYGLGDQSRWKRRSLGSSLRRQQLADRMCQQPRLGCKAHQLQEWF